MSAEQFWQQWITDDLLTRPAMELASSRAKRFAEAYAAAQLAEKEREMERLENKCDLMIRQDREEVWYWADDGEDHPESLACPALIKPDVVRRFVAAEQRLQEAQALNKRQMEAQLAMAESLRQREAELEQLRAQISAERSTS